MRFAEGAYLKCLYAVVDDDQRPGGIPTAPLPVRIVGDKAMDLMTVLIW